MQKFKKIRTVFFLGVILVTGCVGRWLPPKTPGNLAVQIQALEVLGKGIQPGDYVLFTTAVETLRLRVRVTAEPIWVTQSRRMAPDIRWKFPTDKTPVRVTLEVQVLVDEQTVFTKAREVRLKKPGQDFLFEIPLSPGEVRVICRVAPSKKEAQIETPESKVALGVSFTQLYKESGPEKRSFAAVYLAPYSLNLEECAANRCYPIPEPLAKGAYDTLEVQDTLGNPIDQVCTPNASGEWVEFRGWVVARYRGHEVRRAWRSDCWVPPPVPCPEAEVQLRVDHLFLRSRDTLRDPAPYATVAGQRVYSVFLGVPLHLVVSVNAPWQLVSPLPDLQEGVSRPETLRLKVRCRDQSKSFMVVLQPDSVIALDLLAYRPRPPEAFRLLVPEQRTVVLRSGPPVAVRIGGHSYLLEEGRRNRLVVGPGDYTVRFYRADRP